MSGEKAARSQRISVIANVTTVAALAALVASRLSVVVSVSGEAAAALTAAGASAAATLTERNSAGREALLDVGGRGVGDERLGLRLTSG